MLPKLEGYQGGGTPGDIDTPIHDIEVGAETGSSAPRLLDSEGARGHASRTAMPSSFPTDAQAQAYDDTALPIAEGQTISPSRSLLP